MEQFKPPKTIKFLHKKPLLCLSLNRMTCVFQVKKWFVEKLNFYFDGEINKDGFKAIDVVFLGFIVPDKMMKLRLLDLRINTLKILLKHNLMEKSWRLKTLMICWLSVVRLMSKKK